MKPRRGGVAVPSMVAGVGLALSLPPWGFWILAYPAAGLLWWRLGDLRPRARLWAGWLAGLGCFVPGLFWARSFTVPGAIALIAIEALFPAVACLLVPTGSIGVRAIAYPAAMTLAEAARMTWPFGGLPIGGVFLGQAGGPVLGMARLGGPLLLTAAVYVGGVGVACLYLAVTEIVTRSSWYERSRGAGSGRTESRDQGLQDRGSVEPESQGAASSHRGGGALRTGPRHLVLVGAIASIGVVLVAVVAAYAPDGGPSRGTVTAAAVQGGGARGFRKSQVNPAVVLAAQNAATQHMLQLRHGHAPQLVLWPEDVVSLSYPLDGSAEESTLSHLASSLHTSLVVGVTETVSSTAFRNEVVAFGPDGALVSRYEKVHRVPFGEYVPYRGFFQHLANLSSVPLDAVPGTGTGLLPTPAAPLGTLISYEVFYADRGRSAVRAGAQVLIVPTNTSSYATSQVPTQEIAASQVQAVEQGRDLLQSSPTGFSAWINHRGQLLDRSALGTRQVVFATLQRRDGRTLYVRFGDTPVLVLAALAFVGAWALVIARRRQWGQQDQS